MKALTICQPYPHLILIGEKIIENRTWPTSYRGELAIHAGKSEKWLREDDLQDFPNMVFGAVVAIATLVDCIPYEKLPLELKEHRHASGPWCWVLKNVRAIKPVPVNGKQGLWDWIPAEHTSAEEVK